MTPSVLYETLISLFNAKFVSTIELDIISFSRKYYRFYTLQADPVDILLDFCSYRYNLKNKDSLFYV